MFGSWSLGWGLILWSWQCPASYRVPWAVTVSLVWKGPPHWINPHPTGVSSMWISFLWNQNNSLVKHWSPLWTFMLTLYLLQIVIFKIATNPTKCLKIEKMKLVKKKKTKQKIPLYDQVILTNIFMCMRIKNILFIKAYIVLTIDLHFWCYKWSSWGNLFYLTVNGCMVSTFMDIP